MLEAIVSTLKPGFEAAAALSAAAAVYFKRVAPSTEGGPRISAPSLRVVWIAAASIITASIVSGYLINIGVFERELFDGITKLFASLGVMVLLSLLWLKLQNPNLEKALILLSISALILPRATEVALLPAKVFNQIGALNTELLSNTSGIIIGLFAATLSGILLIRSSRRVSRFGLLLSASAVLGVLLAQQIVAFAQFGFAYGFIPLTPFLLSILAPLINNYDYFFYGLLAACSLYLISHSLAPKEKAANESGNPAQRRKQKASARSKRRLAIATLLTILIAGILVASEAFTASYKKMASELSPAEAVKATDTDVRIPIESLSDGRLHRFSFEASDRTRIRFIVIHKGSGVYGVALDFCEICGPTGYYQRGDNVICKNCDVVINIPTIGFSGGCNPFPLNYRIADKRLLILTSDLEAAKQKFLYP